MNAPKIKDSKLEDAVRGQGHRIKPADGDAISKLAQRMSLNGSDADVRETLRATVVGSSKLRVKLDEHGWPLGIYTKEPDGSRLFARDWPDDVDFTPPPPRTHKGSKSKKGPKPAGEHTPLSPEERRMLVRASSDTSRHEAESFFPGS